MTTQTLSSSDDTVQISQDGGRIGTGALTSFIGDLIDGAGGVDTLRIHDWFPANRHFTLAASNDGIITMTTASGVMQFSNFEKIQFDNVTADLGTAGNDTLAGTRYDDAFLVGLAGNDTIDGGTGIDKMYGGAGHDVYLVDVSNDTASELAGGGTDTVQAAATYTLSANVENLILTGTSLINGTGNSSANSITGNAATNILTGLEGADRLDGGLGADQMLGGLGDDTYTIDNAADVVTETVASGVDLVNTSVTITLSANVENATLTGTGGINATGNALANVLKGNAGANTLTGLAGADNLDGGAGADKLIGGLGADTLKGSAGKDTFVFNTAASATAIDKIMDFNSADDTIAIENSVFVKVGAAGALTTAAFWAGASAHDADDRIIYNKMTGALFYDANGNAAGGQVQLAVITTQAAMTVADFIVI